MVRVLTYIRIKYKNNKSSVQYIDQFTLKTVHDITERPKNWTTLLTFCIGSLYDFSSMSGLYIIFLHRMIKG